MSAEVALWHYTCAHGHQGIRSDGHVFPSTFQTERAVGMPGEFAWFTDLDIPIREALGLTSLILHCDRTAYRYRVTDASAIRPWREVRRVYTWGIDLEKAPGARPMHWWVSVEPVPVAYEPIARTA